MSRLYSILFCRPLFYKFHKKIWAVGLRGMGFMNHHDYKVSGEVGALNYFKENNKSENPVVFDIGANFGTWSKLAKEILPTSKIYAFEPVTQTLDKIPDMKGVRKYKLGFGDEVGTTKINFKDAGKGQIFHSDLFNEKRDGYVNSEEIRIETIDNFCKEKNINRIDYLKIDIEGYEYKALLGARKMIKQGKIKFIQFEMGEDNVFNRETLMDFDKLLKDYELYRLLSTGMKKLEASAAESTTYLLQTILAIKKN